MKLKWLDRSTFTMPLYLTLATSQEILDKELKRMKYNGGKIGVPAGKGASVNFIENSFGETSAIVCLFDYKKHDIKQVYSMLCHEAVHIFQKLCDLMGEKNPSIEFEAWTIQKISQDLFYEFDRQTKRKTRGSR